MEPSERDSWARVQIPDRVLKQVPWPLHANRLQAWRCRHVRERGKLSDANVKLDLQNIYLNFLSPPGRASAPPSCVPAGLGLVTRTNARLPGPSRTSTTLFYMLTRTMLTSNFQLKLSI